MSRQPILYTGFNGTSMSVYDWQASKYNCHKLSITTLKQRMNANWGIEVALTLPKNTRRSNAYSHQVVKQAMKQKYLPYDRLARILYRSYDEIRQLQGII